MKSLHFFFLNIINLRFLSEIKGGYQVFIKGVDVFLTTDPSAYYY